MSREQARHELADVLSVVESRVSLAVDELRGGHHELAELDLAEIAQELRWMVRRLLYPVAQDAPAAGLREAA